MDTACHHLFFKGGVDINMDWKKRVKKNREFSAEKIKREKFATEKFLEEREKKRNRKKKNELF